MKSQEWFNERIIKAKALSFRFGDPDIMPELKRVLLEVSDALSEITMKSTNEISDIILDHMFVSQSERNEVYRQFNIPKESAFSCLHL